MKPPPANIQTHLSTDLNTDTQSNEWTDVDDEIVFETLE